MYLSKFGNFIILRTVKMCASVRENTALVRGNTVKTVNSQGFKTMFFFAFLAQEPPLLPWYLLQKAQATPPAPTRPAVSPAPDPPKKVENGKDKMTAADGDPAPPPIEQHMRG